MEPTAEQGNATAPPVAQRPPARNGDPNQPEATIIVTGSRLPRRNLTATSPVTVVASEEVKLEGTTNIEELLNQLPQVAPTQGAFISNGATGTATVDLRSLGPARTLVLVNGRRLGPGDPTQPFPDLNMIPPTMIKRVEVLTGGASSVYGSDAVSGVVNFILDTSVDGLRVDAQRSFYQHDNHTSADLRQALDDIGFAYPRGNTVDGARGSIDVAAGKTILDGRGHVAIYAGYRKQDGLTQDARDYSACGAQVSKRANSVLFCGGSLSSDPSNFFNLVGEEFHTGPDRTFVPGLTQFNFAPFNYYQRPDQRYTAGGFADIEISDAITPYLELMYLNDRSVAQLAASGDFGHTDTINCDNPLLSAQQLEHVCFDGNYVGQEDGGPPTPFIDPVTGATYSEGFLEVDRRNTEGDPRQQDLRHKALRVLGGVKGIVAKGISYDASYLRMKTDMSSYDLHFFSVPHLRRALDAVTDPQTGQPVCRSALTGEDPKCVPWDIFTPGGVTKAAVDYLDTSAFRHGFVREQVGNFNATINLGDWGLRVPWALDDPSINIGAEHRRDELSYVPDPLQFTGDLAGSGNAQLPVHGSTDVKEIFAETRIPIVDKAFVYNVAIEAGYRYSWYSNDQSRVSSDAYKLAIDFAPVRDIRLRASLQRAVRAPNIVELFTPAVDSDFGDDPCVGTKPEATLAQCQLTGVTAAQYGQLLPVPDSAFTGYNAIVGGNPELRPETAKTKTVGVVLEPRFLPRFNATVDWWNIDLEGAIAQGGADLTMQTCIQTGDPVFCALIHRDANGSLWLTPNGYIDDRYINIAAFKVRGVDFGVNYEHGLGSLGSIGAGFLGTRYRHWIIEPGGLAETFDCAGLYGGNCGIPQPRWKHKARLTWTTRGDVSVSVNWRYTGPMKLQPVPDNYVPGPYTRELKAQSFFDLAASARVGERYEFRLGVNNLFDREPPLVPSGGERACEVGCNGNTYPQWYDPLGRYIFAAVSLDLKPY